MEIEARATGHALCNHEPLVFHCHHYNLALQNTIKECNGIVNADRLFHAAGLSTTQSVLEGSADIDEAFVLFSQLGFGSFQKESATQYVLANSHYAVGHAAKYGGTSDTPICTFAETFLEASLRTHAVLSAGQEVRETRCKAQGHDSCVFEVVASEGKASLVQRSHGARFVEKPIDLGAANFGNIDVNGVLGALSQLPLIGNEEGLIPAFGVLLTRHFASYYNGLSYGLLNSMYESGVDIGRELLIEAGHQCAFNTFGGIMVSPEWDAVVLPQIQNQEDWVYGITAVVNALGWGQWQVTDLVPDQKLTMRVTNGYETAGFKAHYHQNNDTTCFLAQGGVAGIMNLVYAGHIANKPTLDQAFYDQLFAGNHRFMATETKCMSRGDDCCEFVATRV